MLRELNYTVKSLGQHFRRLWVETGSHLRKKWGRPEAKAVAVDKERMQGVQKLLRRDIQNEVTKWMRTERAPQF